MGEKAQQKRKYIIEQAEKVFAEMGFKNVTMKDIISACGISRGGVYLYFNSTAEIFEAVLQLKAENAQALAAAPLLYSRSAAKQLRSFLNEQKNELLNPGDSLIIATYEYLFAQGEALDRTALENNFKSTVNHISALIKNGVDRGEFFADPLDAAENIVLFLEGLKISCTVLALEPEFLERQMSYIVLQLQGGIAE